MTSNRGCGAQRLQNRTLHGQRVEDLSRGDDLFRADLRVEGGNVVEGEGDLLMRLPVGGQ